MITIELELVNKIFISENFEKERNDYFDRIEALKIRQEDYHKMEWLLKKREEEIVELQNLLSASNNTLNKERQISISYKNEVETTKSII